MRPQRSAGAACSLRGRVGSLALVVSSLLVIVVAAAFDVVAGQRPDHTISLGVVAVAVGALRWLLRGRLRGVFSLINLAVIAQPVAHGVNELVQDAAHAAPHSHLVPHELSGLLTQLAVALIVAVVAGSEPIAVFVASAVPAVAVALARAGVPDTTAPVVRPPRPEQQTAPVEAGDAVRCRPRRGPPVLVGPTT